jgi:hypothetical protein
MKKFILLTVITAALAILFFSCALGENSGTKDSQATDQALFVQGHNPDATIVSKASGTPTKIVVIIYDGSSSEGKISQAFSAAMANVSGWTSYKGYYVPGTYNISDTKARINDAVAQFGLPESELLCLVIGKSLGGAKTYKMLASNASFFDDFYRNSIVTVDAHEPVAPGDEGRCEYWYDYVYFRCHSSDWNGHYDLAWRSAWNTMDANNQIGFFTMYQRGEWPRGYSFSTADVNWRIYGYDHSDIANCPYTVSLIETAVYYVLS